jgi:hypothetical protein
MSYRIKEDIEEEIVEDCPDEEFSFREGIQTLTTMVKFVPG